MSAAQESRPVVRLEAIEKRFGGTPILRGVSCGLNKGEVGVIIGPSGSGKSTLLRCINGLESFDSGEITVAGEVLSPRQTPGERARRLVAIRKRVGMVFQQFHLFPHLTALENVIEAPVHVLGLPAHEARAKGTELLARVGLADRMGNYPAHLSGGQQQRVAIARTLAMSPDLILFDEPTSALDPQMTQEVLGVMTELARGGQSMLVVTHAMGFARRVGHRLLVLAEGRVVEEGTPAEVLDRPQSEITRRLLSEVES